MEHQARAQPLSRLTISPCTVYKFKKTLHASTKHNRNPLRIHYYASWTTYHTITNYTIEISLSFRWIKQCRYEHYFNSYYETLFVRWWKNSTRLLVDFFIWLEDKPSINYYNVTGTHEAVLYELYYDWVDRLHSVTSSSSLTWLKGNRRGIRKYWYIAYLSKKKTQFQD